jgi:hypothetical protein
MEGLGPQIVEVLLDTPNAQCPGENLQEAESVENCPPVPVHDLFVPTFVSKVIRLATGCDDRIVGATLYSQVLNGVEDKDADSLSLSFDNIPGSSYADKYIASQRECAW